MPHRCMECNSVLESGELDLGTGCPVCGGRKFEYVRPQKKEPVEADLRKLTVSQYVAYADSVEPGHEEKPKHKELKVTEHKAAEQKAAPKPPEEPKPKAKKPAHEGRIDSVRILEKGNYDLNLPMLLSRKELVMSKEDGVYHVDLPSALKTVPKKKKR